MGVATVALTAIAVIVFGGALLLGSGGTTEIGALDRTCHRGGAAKLASGATALGGIGATVLGILALAGVAPLTLTLIALIALGAAAIFRAATTPRWAAWVER
jgi:hypothetical protein